MSWCVKVKIGQNRFRVVKIRHYNNNIYYFIVSQNPFSKWKWPILTLTFWHRCENGLYPFVIPSITSSSTTEISIDSERIGTLQRDFSSKFLWFLCFLREIKCGFCVKINEHKPLVMSLAEIAEIAENKRTRTFSWRRQTIVIFHTENTEITENN